MVTTAFAFEGLGHTFDAGLLLAAGAHLFGVAMTLERVGSAAQRKKWLPKLASGDVLGTVAATEAGAGSDVAACESLLSDADGGLRARGDKRYVTQADRAGLFLFFGRKPSGRGLRAALVEAGAGVTPGALIDTAGLAQARLAPVSFDAPAELLGKDGAGMAVFHIAMTYERAMVLAFRLGAMDRALGEAIAFVRRRRIFGHQAVAHRVARMKLRLETARLMVYRAAWMLDEGERAHSEAALSKWHLAEVAVESAIDAMKLRGGAGFVAPSGLPQQIIDTLGSTIHSGTSDVLANIVAGHLGL